jgi:hypothetical protein
VVSLVVFIGVSGFRCSFDVLGAVAIGSENGLDMQFDCLSGLVTDLFLTVKNRAISRGTYEAEFLTLLLFIQNVLC